MVRRELLFTLEVIFMVFVGIDVAKDKHELYAVDSDGVVLCDHLTFANSAAVSYTHLTLPTICSV